jgi:multiple RNA-binding domain-containing protein 1
VDFIEPSEARAAFKGLAYRRYRHLPLYLEWAPIGIIAEKSSAKEQEKTKSNLSTNGKPVDKHTNNSTDNGHDESDYGTIFIKNFNFTSQEDDLKAHLMKLGISGDSIRSISMPKKKKGDKLLSLGYGFVEFRSESLANVALKRLHGSVLDGHTLEGKPSEKRLSTSIASDNNIASLKEKSVKLIVRNVAFQANAQELRSLFSTFGNVKRIRIPKKMGGVHRGFAFVDFSTHQEAVAAMKALTNTHLYGRHLVIEWAKDDDEDIESLRRKAGNDHRTINTGREKRKIDEAFTS